MSSISSTKTTQEIRSLYLDDTGKNTIVTEATVAADSSTILIPYTADDVYWGGTYHCFSGTGPCKFLVLSSLRCLNVEFAVMIGTYVLFGCLHFRLSSGTSSYML